MQKPVAPTVRELDQCEPYEQEEPGIASFRWVLQQGEIPGLCAGFVTLEGPIHKTKGAHDDWDQMYLIFAGTGTLHLAGESYRITKPAAVIIPRGTEHSVELSQGETIQYVYVNRLDT